MRIYAMLQGREVHFVVAALTNGENFINGGEEEGMENPAMLAWKGALIQGHFLSG
jgi:hypothetical protein